MYFCKGKQSFLKGTFCFEFDVMHGKDEAIIFILVQARNFRYSTDILLFVNILPPPTHRSTAQTVSKKRYVLLAQVKYVMMGH